MKFMLVSVQFGGCKVFFLTGVASPLPEVQLHLDPAKGWYETLHGVAARLKCPREYFCGDSKRTKLQQGEHEVFKILEEANRSFECFSEP